MNTMIVEKGIGAEVATNEYPSRTDAEGSRKETAEVEEDPGSLSPMSSSTTIKIWTAKPEDQDQTGKKESKIAFHFPCTM